MSRIAIAFLVVLFVGTAWAEAPKCEWGDSTGWVMVPMKNGACFAEISGRTGLFFVGKDGLMWAGFEADKDWFRMNPNGETRAHFVSKNVDELVYCSWSVLDAGLCKPPVEGGKPYMGTGRVETNYSTAQPPGEGWCPNTLHYTGEVTSPAGEKFRISAMFVAVRDKDSNWGCRIVVDEVNLKAR